MPRPTLSTQNGDAAWWRREPEETLLPTLRDLGIGLVAWAPLGSGFLTGTVEELSDTDFRQANPRYSPENLAVNRDRFAPIMALAEALGITPAQLALAWLLHQGDDIFVIPGTRNTARIDENLKALFVDLDAATLQRISDLTGPGLAEGTTLI